MLLIFLLLFPQMIVWPNAAAKSTISFGEANSIKTNGPVKEVNAYIDTLHAII